VLDAVKMALEQSDMDRESLEQVSAILEAKGEMSGTKVQLRPIYSKKPKKLQKVQIIIKWGGVFTHGGLHHSIDLAINLRTDLNIMDRDVLNDIKVFSSSEKRVVDTADAFCKSLLNVTELDSDFIRVSKEMLDDSNAAKEQTDFVKSKLQKILNPEIQTKPPVEFIMPVEWPDLSIPIREIIVLMKRMQLIMSENLKTPNTNHTWCCYETPFLFKERWEKLFRDFCDVDRASFEPSRVSELYDALKFDLIHNRDYLYYTFKSVDENLTAELCSRSKDLFDVIGPHEYGIEDSEKLEIGLKNDQVLIRNLVSQLQIAAENPKPLTRLYFTKESKVYSLLNVVLLCGLKTNFQPTDIAELDYLTQITFELYESKTNGGRFSLRVGFSPGDLF
jgi:hypothetical protein